MILTIIIAFFSLIFLVVIHELGHFVLAKKFGVKVEEFGIGFPPRLLGKKFGETLYSLNLLPFGAFVKIPGETELLDDPRSFSQKPIWQRCWIVLGGVISFWIIGVILLSIVMGLGFPSVISDEEKGRLNNPEVQIIGVGPKSPAEMAGLRMGDVILKFKTGESVVEVSKVKQIQELIDSSRGQEITLTIERGKKIFDASLTPRLSPPPGEGSMGVGLVRIATKSYPWYQAPWQGVLAAGKVTAGIVNGWVYAITKAIHRAPSGAQLMGPIGIFHLIAQMGELGAVYFIQFMAMIALYLALFNILPIPAVDGGKLMFLIIEAIRKKPLSQRIEQNVTAVFFALLIVLMVLVTIKDISKFF